MKRRRIQDEEDDTPAAAVPPSFPSRAIGPSRTTPPSHQDLLAAGPSREKKNPLPPTNKKTFFTCGKCGKCFSRLDIMVRHQVRCGVDARSQRTKAARKDHPRDLETNAIVIKSAFNRNLITYFIENEYDAEELDVFFTIAFENIIKIVKRHLTKWKGVKIYIGLDTQYNIPNKEENGVARNFKSKSLLILPETDIGEIINQAIDKIEREMSEYEGKSSGFSLYAIDGVLVNISKYNPLLAACYKPLPPWILKTRAVDTTIYDPSTKDCFRKSIQACDSTKDYDFTRVSFPTSLKDIGRFEEDNPGVTVNVYGIDEEDKVYPLRVSNQVNSPQYKHFDILLIAHPSGQYHFVGILNFERLISSQVTKHHGRIVVCRRCFRHYDDQLRPKEEKLRDHQSYGCMNSPARALLPEEGSHILSFNHHRYKLRLPFVAYADIESLLIPISTCNPSGSFINRYQEHQMMSYSIYVQCDVDTDDRDFNRALTYTGPDAPSHLMATLVRIATKVWKFYSLNTPMSLTNEEWRDWFQADSCHFCGQGFTDPQEDPKVIDHDHITGGYRGASHSSCNVLARTPSFLPLLLHNGAGYDFKFLIRELGKFPGEIRVIPNNEERFISFSKKVEIEEEGLKPTKKKKKKYIWLRFLDSFRFLQGSLDSLAQTLNREDFKILTKLYQGKELELLMKKGVYPYEYMDSWSRLNETSLPPKEKFFSSLNDSAISDSNYSYAQDVWDTFRVRDLRSYMELYLETDTHLLAEVFEKFRREFLSSEYAIDPVYYYTIPGLAFDGMLKITDIKLELLTDFDMLLMFERGIRGGLTQVSERYLKAEQDVAIINVDSNNLYGGASTFQLPCGDFEWVDPESVDLMEVRDDSEVGYIAEVDINIPEELHDYFNSYPPLPEKQTPPGSKFPKLLATLSNKSHYVIHYRVLQFVVSHGCKLIKVHKVISFRQSQWMKPFVSINTKKRTVSTNIFAKNLWKLVTNSTFGKSIESIRKRIDLRLVETWKVAEKLIARPNYQRHTIYDDNLVAIHMRKTKLFFNKPIYVGFTILEMAKLTMLEFYYDTIIKYYGPERLRLLYTDTDSFVLSIKLRQIGEDWRIEASEKLGNFFDFSNLPENHPSFSVANKGVLMKFKDEAAGKNIVEWIGLKSKMYAMRLDDNVEVRKAKGIKKCAVRKKLTFDDYKKALFEGKTFLTTFSGIRSYQQKLYTVFISKLSLSAFDDKRYIVNDGIKTLAHGHHSIEDMDE